MSTRKSRNIIVLLVMAVPLLAAGLAAGLAVASGGYKIPHVPRKYYKPAPDSYKDRGCLRMLRALRVRFKRLRKVKGVATPVRILGGRIGRTRYVPRYKSNAMVMDCRMAVALARANELFKVNRIKAVVHSNFYCWRRVDGSGRLSRHALGLAIDIHAFIDTKGRRISVKKHYEKGLGKGRTCEGRAPDYKSRVLRDLACDLDASRLFETVLTPDYDKGHEDHYHVSVHHPQDRRRHRLFRTVLMEVRGTQYPWVRRRPRINRYSSSRIRRIVKQRWRKRRRWYRWKRRRDRRKRRKSRKRHKSRKSR